MIEAVEEIGRENPPGGRVPPATRVDALLVRVDRLCAWGDAAVHRWLPAEMNPLAQTGAAANFALVVAVVSGVALLVWYSPSLQFAYPSIAALAGPTLGGWVRAVHRYSSDLAMFFILAHAARMLLARKFSGARWLPWVSGVAMVGLVWLIGWTGYWLVWDQPAQQIAVTTMRLLDGLPIFGEPMARLYVTDRLVPSLLFFVVFFTHMLLPLGIAVGLAVHLTRVSRAKLLPNRLLSAAMLVALAVAAVVMPAPLDAPAEMAVKAEAFTVDAWYLAPLALALRLQGAGLWLALGGIFVGVMAVPWLLGRRRKPETFQAVVEPARCHACTQCVQDCPFDAITMVPRTDGKRFPSQAWVDPAKCVGCGVCAGSCDSEGISLPWFDTRVEEARMEKEILDTAEGWVALVGADIDGGVARFAADEWRKRLVGYRVWAVPTASWVRPKFVERLLAKAGVRGVLVVRDARSEAAARDGNRWVSERFEGKRAPIFRPERAGGSEAWAVVDFDPMRPNEVGRAAKAFREEGKRGVSIVRWPGGKAVVAGMVLAVGLSVAVIAPSRMRVANPAPAGPELVFSFKAMGEFEAAAEVDPAVEAAKPVHMRGRSTAKPQRSDVEVRLTIDGVTETRRFSAKGIGRDGPAIDEWRRAIVEGGRDVVVEVITGEEAPVQRWSGRIEARPRRLSVITFEPAEGFRVE